MNTTLDIAIALRNSEGGSYGTESDPCAGEWEVNYLPIAEKILDFFVTRSPSACSPSLADELVENVFQPTSPEQREIDERYACAAARALVGDR